MALDMNAGPVAGDLVLVGQDGKVRFTPLVDSQDTLRINNAGGAAIVQLGTLPTAPLLGIIYLGPVVPSLSNYALRSDGATTILNAPLGSTGIVFRLASLGAPNAMALITDGLGLGINAPTARLHVAVPSAANIGEIIQGAAAQSGNLVEWKDSALAILAAITAAGFLLLPGALRGVGRTTTAAAPTTAEYPADKDWGFHRNSTTGAMSIAYNDAGTIRTALMA